MLAIGLVGCNSKQTQQPLISSDEILEDIAWLASDEMNGRHFLSLEAKKAASFIANEWKASGFVPIPNFDSMFIPIDIPNAAPNVAGMWEGEKNSYVIIMAHYDHLKPKREGEDRIFNGADDNASGTAALIAIAKAIHTLKPKLTSSIVLLATSAEEAGLIGATHFAEEECLPLHQIKAVINLDMISRGDPNTIFLEGSPDAPSISVALHNANQKVGLTIVRDKHPDWMYRGDQRAFWQAGIPSVFLSVEDHEDYHMVSDEVDRVIPELAAKTAEITLHAAIELAGPRVP